MKYERIAPLLALEKYNLLRDKQVPIEVFDGATPSTNGSSIKLPTEISYVAVSEDTSPLEDPNTTMYVGFLLHEVAHIMYNSTDLNLEEVLQEKENPAFFMSVLNVVEDARINYIFKEEFKGSPYLAVPFTESMRYVASLIKPQMPDSDEAAMLEYLKLFGVHTIEGERLSHINPATKSEEERALSYIFDDRSTLRDIVSQSVRLGFAARDTQATVIDSYEITKEIYQLLGDKVEFGLEPSSIKPQLSFDNDSAITIGSEEDLESARPKVSQSFDPKEDTHVEQYTATESPELEKIIKNQEKRKKQIEELKEKELGKINDEAKVKSTYLEDSITDKKKKLEEKLEKAVRDNNHAKDLESKLKEGLEKSAQMQDPEYVPKDGVNDTSDISTTVERYKHLEQKWNEYSTVEKAVDIFGTKKFVQEINGSPKIHKEIKQLRKKYQGQLDNYQKEAQSKLKDIQTSAEQAEKKIENYQSQETDLQESHERQREKLDQAAQQKRDSIDDVVKEQAMPGKDRQVSSNKAAQFLLEDLIAKGYDESRAEEIVVKSLEEGLL